MSDENNENIELEAEKPTDELPPTTDENAVVDDVEDVDSPGWSWRIRCRP